MFIELFPKVYHNFSQIPPRLLALTGARLKGKQVSALGLSTHFCKSSLLPKLCQEMAFCKPGEVGQVLMMMMMMMMVMMVMMTTMMIMMMMMMVGQVLDHFMRESGGSVEEENQLGSTWSKAEQPGDLAATFARWESDVRASKIEIIKVYLHRVKIKQAG